MKDITDRKPDLETESFRMWKSKKGSKEAKEIKKWAKEDGFEIPLNNGTKLKLIGFNRAKNSKDEVIFAWKIQERTIKYWYKEDKEFDAKDLITQMKRDMPIFEYIDMNKKIEEIQNEPEFTKEKK